MKSAKNVDGTRTSRASRSSFKAQTDHARTQFLVCENADKRTNKLHSSVTHLIHRVVAGYGRPHVDDVLVLRVVWRHVEARRKLHAVDDIFLDKQ